MVVQKRVSLRLFLDDKTVKSAPPSTVVDTQVVSPHFCDFYLVPCEAPSNAGVASPTRYIVVWDECKMTTDELQAITQQMCYLYFNWSGPVRVPAPCFYAHKIAFLYGKSVFISPDDNDVVKTVPDELAARLHFI